MTSQHPNITKSIKIVLKSVETDGLLLFGSYARGDFTPESDIDFVTLGKKFDRTKLTNSQPPIDISTHPRKHYLSILNKGVLKPFEDSLFLRILQESDLIREDCQNIFSQARIKALNWSWPDEVSHVLSLKLKECKKLVNQTSNLSEPIRKHLKQRIGLFDWNYQRIPKGLALLRRLKDIYRQDVTAPIGSLAECCKSEEIKNFHLKFIRFANQVLTGANRQPFTEIKDTINAYQSARFDEWILSISDSLIFLASMGMKTRDHPIRWKVLDIQSEIKLLEETRRYWLEFRELHDRFNNFLV